MAEVYPDTGRRIAYLPEVGREMRKVALAIERDARSILLAHHHDGHARIELNRGQLDYYISLSDERGLHAAAAIEFGTYRSVGVGALMGAISMNGMDARTKRRSAQMERARKTRARARGGR